MQKNIIFTGILWAICIPVLGQSIVNYESYFDNYLIRNLDREDGLYRDEIYDIHQDSSGFIWIANYSFLFKYDGIKLKPFTESSYLTGIIPEISVDKSSNMILLGVENGIQTKVGDSLRIQNSELGLIYSAYSSISRTKGDSLFVGDYENGLSIVFEDTVIASFDSTNGLAGNKIEKIITDTKNRVWVATTSGLSVFQKGRIHNFFTSNGMPDNSINTLTEMNDGTIWVGTETQGIVVFDDLSIKKTFNTSDGLSDNSIEYINQHPIDHSVWIGYISEGIDRYIDGKIDHLTEEDGLISDKILVVKFDDKGRVYIGTTVGLTILIPRLIDVIDERTLGFISTETNSVEQDSTGTIYVGTISGGLMKYDQGAWTNIRYSETRTNESISAIEVANDSTIFISTSELGIVKMVNGEIVGTKTPQDGLTSNYIICLETDNDGNLIVGTFDGLNIINQNWEITHTLTSENGLPGNRCFNTATDKDGDVWISTVDDGIYELRGTQVISHYDTTDGLNDNRVFGITADSKGEIWVASLGYGFYRVTENGLQEYTNLPDNFVSVTEDDFGNFWFSSNGYIAHVKRDELDKFDTGELEEIQFQRFTVDDGFPLTRVNYGNSSLTKKIDTGEILITTKKGLAVINPTKTEADRSSFFPYFDGLTVDGAPRSMNEKLIIEPSESRIEISFSALNISSPKKTRFRTKLVGYDEGWINIGERTTTYFDFLPHGNYQLLISAIDQAGVWSDKTASMSFTVLPPFYKTWWFIGFCLLGFIGIGAGGVYWRSNFKLKALNRELETQHKIQKERERISRELHDNVGSQITNLITGIEISNLYVHKNQQENALSVLKNLDQDARAAMTDLRETIWLLDKEEVHFATFTDHLKGFLNRQKSYLNGMEVNLDSDIDADYVLDPTQSLNLTRIIQEALNNARKHAQADSFRIQFRSSKSGFDLTLSDDGIGMDESKVKQYNYGNGLKNMKERTHQFGGTITFKSKKGEGTIIQLHIP
jgi:signal transduction histidine kinase/ligand-binding sensor domain-containing protein